MNKYVTQDRININYLKFNQIIEAVDEIIKEYPELSYSDFTAGIGIEYDDFAALTYVRPMNDKERKNKDEQDAINLKWREDADRLTYERLKKKFKE